MYGMSRVEALKDATSKGKLSRVVCNVGFVLILDERQHFGEGFISFLLRQGIQVAARELSRGVTSCYEMFLLTHLKIKK